MNSDFERAAGGMIEIPQWFTWCLRWDATKGKYNKTPWKDGRAVDAGDARNWTDYATAKAMIQRLDTGSGEVRYALGFRLTEGCGYFLYDLDKCVTAGVPNEFTQLMINAFPGAMLEYSSSGAGVHIIGRCSEILHRSMRPDLSIEFYSRDRGIAFGIDGRAWGCADTHLDAAVIPLVEKYFKPNALHDGVPRALEWRGPDDDSQLLRRAYGAKQSAFTAFGGVANLQQLMEGPAEQNNENDSRLASHLAWWTGRDMDRIERIMRTSKLYRAKWDEYRPQGGSYLRMSIQNACAIVDGCYVERLDAVDSVANVASKNTELANAYRLQARHGDDLLAVAGIGWHVWGDAGPWKHDDHGAYRLAFGLGQAIQQEADELDTWVYQATVDGEGMEERKRREDIQKNRAGWAKASESKAVIEHSLSLAEKLLGTTADELDTQPLLVGCPSGVIDLSEGTMREHRREDRITKMIACDYDPNATSPTWSAFISEVLGGDQELIDYVQTLCGYTLSAKRGEHLLPILWGTGANGKSTFLSTLQTLLGDYAGTAAPGLLLTRGGNDHPTGLASLQGRRMVVVAETGEAGRLNEEQVKLLTGGDRITARRMRQDFYEFAATHLIYLMTNHKPRVQGTDLGIWRRLKLIPFTVTIPQERRDPELPAKLLAELPGVLAWAVEGFKKYQQHGFVEPAVVKAATSEYRAASDKIGAFIGERCNVGEQYTSTAGAIYAAYKLWCAENGEPHLTQTAFGLSLSERPGIVKTRSDRSRGWRGLGIDAQAFSVLSPAPTLSIVKL